MSLLAKSVGEGWRQRSTVLISRAYSVSSLPAQQAAMPSLAAPAAAAVQPLLPRRRPQQTPSLRRSGRPAALQVDAFLKTHSPEALQTTVLQFCQVRPRQRRRRRRRQAAPHSRGRHCTAGCCLAQWAGLLQYVASATHRLATVANCVALRTCCSRGFPVPNS